MQRRLRQLDYTLIVASHGYDLAEELADVKVLLRRDVDAPLTEGSQHDVEIGEIATEYLVAQIRQEALQPPAEMETRLIVRETTAKPRGRCPHTLIFPWQ